MAVFGDRIRVTLFVLPEEAIDSYICSLCKEKFIDLVEFDKHQRACFSRNKVSSSDEANNQFVCTVCGVVFSNVEFLTHHQLEHGEPYFCILCNTEFGKNRYKFREHLRSHQRSQKRLASNANWFQCVQCGETFGGSRALSRHQRNHSLPYGCVECGLTFGDNWKKFLDHQWHHKRRERRRAENASHPCPECNARFGTRAELAAHRSSHTEPYQCPHCDLTFERFHRDKYLNHLKNHKLFDQQTTENGIKKERDEEVSMEANNDDDDDEEEDPSANFDLGPPYVCPRCKKNFGEFREKYITHLRHHRRYDRLRPGSMGEFKCKRCNETFSTRLLWQRHQKMDIHVGQTLCCPWCKRNFDDRHKYIKHLQHHRRYDQKCGTQSTFTCERCECRFNNKEYWMRHQKIHKIFDSMQQQQQQSRPNNHQSSTGQQYTCTECSQAFESIAQLVRHVKDHQRQKDPSSQPNVKLYRCLHCKSSFKDKELMTQHRFEHRVQQQQQQPSGSRKHSRRLFRCCKCSIAFGRYSILKKHKEYHKRLTALSTKTRPVFTCDFCRKIFWTSGVHERHSDAYHDSSTYAKSKGTESSSVRYGCSHCVRTFDCPMMLARHEENHRDHERRRQKWQNPFKCSRCRNSFLTPEELAAHEVSHVEIDTSTPHVCELCSRPFRYAGLKVHHMEMMHSRAELLSLPVHFECSMCDRIFVTEERFRLHEMTDHPSVAAAQAAAAAGGGRSVGDDVDDPDRFRCICSTCGNRFKNPTTLALHQRIHTGEKPYQCRVPGCDRHFSQPSTRSYHERTHSDATPYVCPDCGRGFKHVATLKLHSSVHTGERRHVCQECSKAFRKRHSLQLHMRIHTGEQPYVCSKCPSKFVSKSQLHRHENALHNREKLWHCSVCQKAFTQPGNLRTHMRTHTGEKPYACEVCSMRFSHSGTLKGHMRTHSVRDFSQIEMK